MDLLIIGFHHSSFYVTLILELNVSLHWGSGGRRPGPPAPGKTSKKKWPPPRAASFVSHRAPLGQISGSATGYDSNV